MNAPTAAAPVPVLPSASGRSIASLVLGILGLLMCQLLSPLAWYFGWSELRDIARGLAPSAGKDYATVGMVLGIVGSALMALAVLVIGLVAIFVISVIVAAGHAGH